MNIDQYKTELETYKQQLITQIRNANAENIDEIREIFNTLQTVHELMLKLDNYDYVTQHLPTALNYLQNNFTVERLKILNTLFNIYIDRDAINNIGGL